MIKFFRKRPEREIDKIIIHCSVSDYATRKWFFNLHVIENGWSDIGYHFLIMNSKSKPAKTLLKLNPEHDGRIVWGRDVEIAGAHCRGDNKTSIGICLVGIDLFSARQIYSLITLIEEFKFMYPNIKLFGHYEMESGIKQGKTCPNIDMNWLRKQCRITNEKT